jgi:PAS domain S-box-containing protein
MTRPRYWDFSFLAGYALCTIWLTYHVISVPLQDTILYILTIPVLFAAFYRPRWLYLSMVSLLTVACIWEIALISPAPAMGAVVLCVSFAAVVAASEVLYWLGRDRQEKERALRESEGRYRTLMENLPIGMFRTTPEPGGRFLMANEALVQMHGCASMDELLATPVAALYMDPRDRERLSALLSTEGKVTAKELTLRKKDGAPLWASITAMAIKDQDGNVRYFDGLLEDITARKTAERIMLDHRMKMVASSRLSSLGIMARGVAHEINNPLAIISIGLEQIQSLLHEEPSKPEKIETIIETLTRNVDRIQRIVRGLRNLAREGRQDPFQTRLLGELVDDALELCKGPFRNNQIQLHVDDIPRNLEIECRGPQISQIVMNLLSNAEDAAAESQNKWVRLGFTDSGDTIELSVTDSGKGPEDQLRETIFEPFFTTKEVGRGTGLGLSIARAMAESHHGALFLADNGPNTRFVLRLPKRQPPHTRLPNGG